MEDVDRLFDKAVSEIERMLNTKTVVGEPISIEGNTLIPLVSVGFGFGVGGGKGTDPKRGSGTGSGTGGGGGVKPVALIIINSDGVRLEKVRYRLRAGKSRREYWQDRRGKRRKGSRVVGTDTCSRLYSWYFCCSGYWRSRSTWFTE